MTRLDFSGRFVRLLHRGGSRPRRACYSSAKGQVKPGAGAGKEVLRAARDDGAVGAGGREGERTRSWQTVDLNRSIESGGLFSWTRATGCDGIRPTRRPPAMKHPIKALACVLAILFGIGLAVVPADAHDPHSLVTSQKPAQATPAANVPTVPAPGISGQGMMRFKVLYTSDLLPEDAKKVLTSAHRGFAVDRREGRGETYFALPGAGILQISGDLKAIRLIETPAEMKNVRSEEHTSELQSPCNLVCRLLLEKKKKTGCSTCCQRCTSRQRCQRLHTRPRP